MMISPTRARKYAQDSTYLRLQTGLQFCSLLSTTARFSSVQTEGNPESSYDFILSLDLSTTRPAQSCQHIR